VIFGFRVNATYGVLLQQYTDWPRRDEVAKVEHAREPALKESSQYGRGLGTSLQGEFEATDELRCCHPKTRLHAEEIAIVERGLVEECESLGYAECREDPEVDLAETGCVSDIAAAGTVKCYMTRVGGR
jgi:hypothetical protein